MRRGNFLVLLVAIVMGGIAAFMARNWIVGASHCGARACRDHRCRGGAAHVRHGPHARQHPGDFLAGRETPGWSVCFEGGTPQGRPARVARTGRTRGADPENQDHRPRSARVAFRASGGGQARRHGSRRRRPRRGRLRAARRSRRRRADPLGEPAERPGGKHLRRAAAAREGARRRSGRQRAPGSANRRTRR